MTSRSSNYSKAEDKLLCQVYLNISQDPITGRHQSSVQFWTRVEVQYHEMKNSQIKVRSDRSLQCRMLAIIAEVKKLNGCVRQIENLNSSGASEADILERAKKLLMQDPKYANGFKFDHVWNMVKSFEKFQDNVPTSRKVAQRQNHNIMSSQSESLTPDSPMDSTPGLSSFSPNMNADDFFGSSSERPCGVKKAKSKRKNEQDMSEMYTKFEEENKKLMEVMNKNSEDRESTRSLIQRNIALKEVKEENRILYMDLNSIHDPNIREFTKAQQRMIMAKRNQEQGSSSTNVDYHFNFGDIGGSESDLPDY